MQITFTVPAVPIAQPRHRIGTIAGKARAFESPKSHPIHAYKATVRHAAAEVYNGPPLDGPLKMQLQFVLPRPKGKTWKTKPMPRYWHASRPDTDNLAKAVKDALSGLCYVDDAQICTLEATKMVADGSEQPHTLVRLTQLER